MNPRRRPIDPAREIDALDRIPAQLIREAEWVKKSHDLGIQCWILDAISDAMIYGASLEACCELLDLNARTVQRWLRRRQIKLDEMSDS